MTFPVRVNPRRTARAVVELLQTFPHINTAEVEADDEGVSTVAATSRTGAGAVVYITPSSATVHDATPYTANAGRYPEAVTLAAIARAVVEYLHWLSERAPA